MRLKYLWFSVAFRHPSGYATTDCGTTTGSQVLVANDLSGLMGHRVGSVRTGDSERDRTLLDREWFDPRNHAESRFESETIEATETGFRANGQLTLKGVTQPVTMDFTFEDTGSGTTAHFSGTFELERLLFGVGEGFWIDTSWTSNEVTVTVELDLEL